MEEKTLITESITVSFINEKGKIVDINIPFNSISVLEMEDVTTTIGHDSKGEFIEFYNCGTLNLRLFKDKVDTSIIDEFINNSVLSLKLNFNDGTSRAYNVKWYSDDKITNELQTIYDDDNIFGIDIN